MKGFANELKERSAVKHIQIGNVFLNNDYSTIIPLEGFTNADKMVAILNGSNYHSSSSSGNYMSQNQDPYVGYITTESLAICYVKSNTVAQYISYQVIEFM